MAIQLQYRKIDMYSPKRWEVYAESRIITKDMRHFIRDLNKDAYHRSEVRIIDTKKNPEMAS